MAYCSVMSNATKWFLVRVSGDSASLCAQVPEWEVTAATDALRKKVKGRKKTIMVTPLEGKPDLPSEQGPAIVSNW